MFRAITRFIKNTALWIVAVPLLAFYLGAAANQVVLVANHDRFPVMWNTYKAAAYEKSIIDAVQEAKDPAQAEQAQFDLIALETAGYLDDTHCLMTSSTHLNFLADWIDLKSATYSPGDLLLMLGSDGMDYAPWIWAAFVIAKLGNKDETRLDRC